MDKLYEPTTAFCESTLFNGCPEYVNVISSLYFCFVSFINFKYTTYHKLYTEIFTYNLFMFALGVASIVYHSMCNTYGKLLDETAMLLLVCLIIINYIHVIISNVVIKFIMGCLVILYCITIIIINVVYMNIILFSICFMIPIISTIIHFEYNIRYYVKLNVYTLAIWHMNVGVAIISCLMWIITELFCEYVGYLFGHAIWHVGMCWFVHHIIQLIIYINDKRRYGIIILNDHTKTKQLIWIRKYLLFFASYDELIYD
jgi:hypothetical protein